MVSEENTSIGRVNKKKSGGWTTIAMISQVVPNRLVNPRANLNLVVESTAVDAKKAACRVRTTVVEAAESIQFHEF